MTEEEKAKLEAEQAEATAKAAAEAKDDDPSENDPDGTGENEEESKQLEAELKREREAREKSEKAAADLAFKLREQKRKQQEQAGSGGKQSDEDFSEDDKPLTRSEFLALQAQERAKMQKTLREEEAKRLTEEFATSDIEKQLILEKWKNRTFPEGISLEEQIEECYLAANRKKILGENSELKRALRGKSGVSRDASTTHHDTPQTGQPKLASDVAAVMAQVGFKWNSASRRYEKKLANGKVLVKDHKTGNTRLE